MVKRTIWCYNYTPLEWAMLCKKHNVDVTSTFIVLHEKFDYKF